jgi:hypothetical protein
MRVIHSAFPNFTYALPCVALWILDLAMAVKTQSMMKTNVVRMAARTAAPEAIAAEIRPPLSPLKMDHSIATRPMKVRPQAEKSEKKSLMARDDGTYRLDGGLGLGLGRALERLPEIWRRWRDGAVSDVGMWLTAMTYMELRICSNSGPTV